MSVIFEPERTELAPLEARASGVLTLLPSIPPAPPAPTVIV